MGIDRIGKGGAPPPTPEPQGTTPGQKKSGVESSFATKLDEVQATRSDAAHQTAAATNVEATQGASPLARLRAGEIDVNGYVDLKVEEAVKGLDGLSAAEIDDVRKMLRDQLATDPGLADLVRSATGQVPSPPED